MGKLPEKIFKKITQKKKRTHDRLNPRMELLYQYNLPHDIKEMGERVKELFSNPQKFKELLAGRARAIRSERKEACVLVLLACLRHLNLVSMRFGFPQLTNPPVYRRGFNPTPLREMIRISGLGRRRFERALKDLVEAGYIEAKKQVIQREGRDEYVFFPSVRMFTYLFFKRVGFTKERIKAIRDSASKALKSKLKGTGLTTTEAMSTAFTTLKDGKDYRYFHHILPRHNKAKKEKYRNIEEEIQEMFRLVGESPHSTQ